MYNNQKNVVLTAAFAKYVIIDASIIQNYKGYPWCI